MKIWNILWGKLNVQFKDIFVNTHHEGVKIKIQSHVSEKDYLYIKKTLPILYTTFNGFINELNKKLINTGLVDLMVHYAELNDDTQMLKVYEHITNSMKLYRRVQNFYRVVSLDDFSDMMFLLEKLGLVTGNDIYIWLFKFGAYREPYKFYLTSSADFKIFLNSNLLLPYKKVKESMEKVLKYYEV